MKIKVELDLQDMINDLSYEISEGEFDLKESVKADIKRSVITHISKGIGEKTQKAIAEDLKPRVRNICNEIMHEKIVTLVNDISLKGEFPDLVYGSSKVTSLTEIVKTSLSEGLVKSSFNSALKDASKEFANELKDRYDMSFAVMIVNNMAKNGLLKDGVKSSISDLIKQTE